MSDPEVDAYLSNLETLVKSRTEQLRAALTLYEKTIGELQKLNDLRVDSVIENVRKEFPGFASPQKPTESKKPQAMPPADIDTLKTVWQIRKQLGPSRLVDVRIYEQACKPGADVISAAHRMGAFMLMIQMMPHEFDGLLQDGKPNDALFDLIAHVPMTFPGTMSFAAELKELRDRAPSRP